ncbi:hypothetical protein EV363DRAFT_1217689 [Boletus edulis]|nr:hypothetical protein EV363DRAFT_1217689 [Boletus edulis]
MFIVHPLLRVRQRAAHNELMTGEQVTTYSEDGEIHERDEQPYIQRNGNENGTKPYIYAGTTRAIGMR